MQQREEEGEDAERRFEETTSEQRRLGGRPLSQQGESVGEQRPPRRVSLPSLRPSRRPPNHGSDSLKFPNNRLCALEPRPPVNSTGEPCRYIFSGNRTQ